ncbi:AAA domain-containing protein [Streptomyces sp. NPDC057011]|uniref:caspase, EACC1-associated type n=1 Tax=unclassified Streptomyces TaxID=2593676 RepID=UPI00363981A3
MSRNHALLIGTANYEDPAYAPLAAVRADVHYLSQVLEMPSVGRFEESVRVEDSTKAAITQAVEDFLADREGDELVVLYLSGHGAYEREDGQLYYVAADTRADEVQRTGVKASFITEQLEACAARRKVLLLDCCFSGAAVQGFRSKGGTSQKAGADLPAVEASGVYVITASHHWEESFTSTPGDPSQFTQALVRGLHTGQADLDGDGQVSADDLFRYVSRELKNAPADRQQTPTKSSLSVTGDIFLAKAAVGRQIPALKPLDPGTFAVDAEGKGVAVPESVVPAVAAHDDTAFGEADWPKLFDYYLACLRQEEASGAFLPLPGSTPARALWPGGQESLLSGASDTVPAPEGVVRLAAQARKDGAELWYGYPTVVLFDGNKQKCAPLFMRQIEVAEDAGGVPMVVAAGPAVPHAQLVLERLGKDEGLELLATYRPSWRPGFRDEMVRDLRVLLDELALPDTEHLDPGALGDGATLRAPHEGARNLALVFAARSEQGGSSKQLVKDYQKMRSSVAELSGTALGALARREEPDPAAEEAVRIVAPLAVNEGQEAVIRAAMTRRLTVATGPPGTGKSQLIVNAVATARAAGLTVLVASTNNKAVDEVWERAEELAPGLLVRTGSRSGERDNVEDELEGLTRLTGVTRPPRSSQAHGGELRNATRELEEVRRRLADVAERERLLSAAAQRRHTYAETCRSEVAVLAAAFGDDTALERWRGAAHRVARAAFFKGFRRRRAVGRLPDLPVQVDGPEDFAELLAFADDEASWRHHRALAEGQPGDADLSEALRAAEQRVRDMAQGLLGALVDERAAGARQLLHDRIEAVRSTSPRQWATLDSLLPSVSGWAVTARSVRRFRDRPGLFDLVIIDEASQCSTTDVLPLLFRAKRALVIGDPMQLPHITQLQAPQEAEARDAASVRASWLEEHRLAHRSYSSFHAAAHASGGPLLLDEHFRCHPDIAEISNRYCYAGRLTVLTDPRTLRRLDGVGAVQWLDVPGRARAGRGGSWINSEEADRVHVAIERLLTRLPAGSTIGVVTPFRAQKELIARRWAREQRVRVGTVHTFQGGQQDVMLLSLVAGPQMRASAVGWLTRETNLWNVAITRARSHLIVLGDREFWSGQGGMAGALQDAAAGHARLDPAAAVEQEPWPLLVGDRLQKLLGDAVPGALTDRDVVRDGYRCDFELRLGDRTVPMLLDHGVPEDGNATRHVRLALTRTRLVPGGIRVPAWEVWDGRTRRITAAAQRPV